MITLRQVFAYCTTPTCFAKTVVKYAMYLEAHGEVPKRYRPILFIRDMVTWAKSGFRLAGLPLRIQRKRICSACEHFAKKPIPHCQVCGCSTAKWRVASAHCPLLKW